MYTGIIYVSNAAYRFEDFQLQELADQSSEKNQRLGVTGYLYYADEMFMQYIEGEQDVTLKLMDIIRRDERHTVIEELVDPQTKARKFSDWNMRWLKRRDLEFLQLENVLMEFMRGKSFFQKPEEWNSGVWALTDQLAVCHRQLKRKNGPIIASNIEECFR